MADVVYLRSYDDRTRVDDETARRVLDATVGLLRDVPYSSITMRSIAKRAAVSHGEVRAHFRSKDAIVAEIYLERLRAVPLIVDVDEAARARIHGELQRRVRTALRSGAWPEVAETLEFGLVGALVHASCGADTFRQTADDLASLVAVVLPGNH
jgi:AcrR family transcriptional regulator